MRPTFYLRAHVLAECVRHYCPDPTLSGIFLPTMRGHHPVLSGNMGMASWRHYISTGRQRVMRLCGYAVMRLWTVWSSVEKARLLFKITSKQIIWVSGGSWNSILVPGDKFQVDQLPELNFWLGGKKIELRFPATYTVRIGLTLWHPSNKMSHQIFTTGNFSQNYESWHMGWSSVSFKLNDKPQ